MTNGRGRPPLDCAVTQINLTLSLRAGRDDDLLAFFVGIPPRKRAIAVRSALRAGGIMPEDIGGVSEDDFDDDLDDFLFG